MKFAFNISAFCLFAVLSIGMAYSQIEFQQSRDSIATTTTSPVAFLYVSSSLSTGNQINAFTVATNGHLTPVTGSPFSADVQSMALKGKYLFGTNGTEIFSFSIGSSGALKLASSVNAQQFNGFACGGPISLFPDLTGVTLYDADYDGESCANNTYQFFGIDQPSGALNYLGASDATVQIEQPLSFIGNNLYGYSSGCFHQNPIIFGYARNSDGTLTRLNINPPLPTPRTGEFYCPYHTAADTRSDFAISLQRSVFSGGPAPGPADLAVYTADSSGNLTTNSTVSNMPSTPVGYVTDVRMSPSGNVLAVSGTTGLQLFRFNGSNPITHFTGLLTKTQVDQVSWDTHNHVFAISNSGGLLYAFTITRTGAHQVMGSPYAIISPQSVVALSK